MSSTAQSSDNYTDKYDHYNDMEDQLGGKGGKNRPKGGAGAGQGKDKCKGDASKGATTAIMNAEKKRAEANK